MDMTVGVLATRRKCNGDTAMVMMRLLIKTQNGVRAWVKTTLHIPHLHAIVT